MVTHERLLEALDYSPVSGTFTWRIKPCNRVEAGSVAGSPIDGYIRIYLDGQGYRAHRLAWFYVKGVWPSGFIDHKDTNRSNNSWLNLREATRSQNNQNRNTNKNSLTGVKGVYQIASTGKYSATIQHNRVIYRLGSAFATIEEAQEAVRLKREELHKNFTNHG